MHRYLLQRGGSVLHRGGHAVDGLRLHLLIFTREDDLGETREDAVDRVIGRLLEQSVGHVEGIARRLFLRRKLRHRRGVARRFGLLHRHVGCMRGGLIRDQRIAQFAERHFAVGRLKRGELERHQILEQLRRDLFDA